MATKFSTLIQDPIDPIYGMEQFFARDPRTKKINLGIGICKSSNGEPYFFEAVREAERQLISEKFQRGYLPITGYRKYCLAVEALVLGDSLVKERKESVYTVQTIGGTGAIFIAAHFIKRSLSNLVYIADQSWVNHRAIFESVGCYVRTYPYYDRETGTIQFEALTKFLEEIEEESVLVLQASCHNPTGMDFTQEQWKVLSVLLKKKKIIPLFDLAYQGLGNGLDEDAESIRLFVREGHDLLIATTFSKNFGLYNQRTGALLTITSPNHIQAAISQIETQIRRTYSSPPAHGAFLVEKVCSDYNLRSLWEKELTELRLHIIAMKNGLYEELKKTTFREKSAHLLQTTGLFTLLNFEPKEIQFLEEEQGVYMLKNGRINLGAIMNHSMQSEVATLLSSLPSR